MREQLVQLEWLYISLLTSIRRSSNPKVLHEELAISPNFYIDVLKWVYMPNNKELSKQEQHGLSDEVIQNRARQAYELLHSWKNIPGVNDLGQVDNEFLGNWVKTVRGLAEDWTD